MTTALQLVQDAAIVSHEKPFPELPASILSVVEKFNLKTQPEKDVSQWFDSVDGYLRSSTIGIGDKQAIYEFQELGNIFSLGSEIQLIIPQAQKILVVGNVSSRKKIRAIALPEALPAELKILALNHQGIIESDSEIVFNSPYNQYHHHSEIFTSFIKEVEKLYGQPWFFELPTRQENLISFAWRLQ